MASLSEDGKEDSSNGADTSVEEASPATEGASGEPKPSRSPPPRRIFLPDPGPTGQGVNLQFVSGQQPPAKAPPKKKLSPFEQATADAVENWEQEAANLADTVTWELERVGPVIHNNKRVSTGTFPQEFSGRVTHSVIGEIAGGGKYYVKYDDPKTGKPKKIGPFIVAGDPKMKVGVTEDNDQDDTESIMDFGVPMDFRASSMGKKPEPEEWINTYDQRWGWVKRKKSDVEREGRAQQTEPALEAIKMQMHLQTEAAKTQQQAQIDALKLQMQAQADAAKQQIESMKELVKSITDSQNRAPREDPATKWLEIERLRLTAEQATKTEEMKFLRDKMISDREVLEAKLEAERKAADAKIKADRDALETKMQHEKDVAETRLTAERLRAETEKAAMEARLEAERDRIFAEKAATDARLAEAQKAANEKLEKAHETMMAMVREKSNPMDQVGNIFSLFRDFNDVMTPEKEDNDGVAKANAPKSRLDKFLDLATNTASKLLPTLEPLAKRAVENYMEGQQQAQQQAPQPARIPQRQPQQHRPPKATPAPEAEGVVSATDSAPPAPPPSPEETQTGIGKLLSDVNNMIDRSVAPSVAWNTLSEEQPFYAAQLKAYTTPQQMADELTDVAGSPGFEKYQKMLLEVAKKITGIKKRWAEDFLAVVQKSE
jgi:hypothetical protein